MVCSLAPRTSPVDLARPSRKAPPRAGLAVCAAALLVGLGAACGGASESSTGGRAGAGSSAAAQTPFVTNPGPQFVDEEHTLVVPIQAHGALDVEGLPPGAVWNGLARQIVFRPDFIQGGATFTVRITAHANGASTAPVEIPITVRDTITPPWPTITSRADHGDHERLVLRQGTDTFLDSPGYAGRGLTARVVVNKAANAQNRRPVRVHLHGFGGSAYTGGRTGEFAVYAHDPMNSYWWGYAENLPGSATGAVRPYTLRRVLHLVEWVLKTYPGADPERVYVVGGSMGGTGAALLGLLHARHFSFVHATIGQKIARNHRPARVTQLQGLWGTMAANLTDGDGMSVWDRQDLTRALLDTHEARDQFIFTKHGKDDATIHFGAVVLPSPLTGVSFYRALQLARAGHYAVWDEGGHGSADPVLGASWWDGGWNPVFDATTQLRRNQPFPAFAQSSLDDDPGQGLGNGRRSWSPNSGFAGTVSTAGDTGWEGAIAGAINRHLRWRSDAVVDLPARFEMPLRVHAGTGGAAPRAGYPTTGDRVARALPATTSVTIRRTQRFRAEPFEPVRWSFGGLGGTTLADADGVVTVSNLPLTESWTTLVLERR